MSADLDQVDETTLDVPEVARLARLEIVIEDGLATFVKVGEALLAIRSERLYRESHDTFEDYCQERWTMGRNYANKLIASAEVVAALEPMGTTVPTTQRQARELAPLLDEPETLREAWTEASTNGTPTAAQVREVVARHRPAAPTTDDDRERQHRWAATVNVLDGLLHFDRDPIPAQAQREAALLDTEVAVKRGESLTPDRLRRASAWAALLADALERNST